MGTRGAVWVQNHFKAVSSQCCCAGTAHGRGRETVTYRRNLPQTHTKPKLPAEGSLLRLPAQIVWGTQPGTPAGRAGHTAPASPGAALPRACASGTHTQTLPHLHLAVTASSTQGNIPPVDWEELQLFCFILLCPQCAITQNTES